MYGSCPALLLEPQRTNLALQSESFDNASWTKATVTVTANYSTAPDGTMTAERIVPTGGNNGGYINRVYQPINTISGSTYTISVWAKSSASNPKMTLAIVNTGGQVFSITNQWARYSVVVSGGGLAANFNIYAGDITFSTGVTNSNNEIEIWGAQCELGAYSSTYIPTTTASATRIADSFSRNNIYTNGLITSSGGTWFVQFRVQSNAQRDNSNALKIGDASNSFDISGSTSGYGFIIGKIVSATYSNILFSNLGASAFVKLAIKWNGTTADVFANGTKVVSATSFTPTDLPNLSGSFGSALFIQQMALFPSPLSDTDCTTLTTL
jgi:hypothetical protein